MNNTKFNGFEHHSANKCNEYPYVSVADDASTTMGEGREARSSIVSHSLVYLSENTLSRPKSNVCNGWWGYIDEIIFECYELLLRIFIIVILIIFQDEIMNIIIIALIIIEKQH